MKKITMDALRRQFDKEITKNYDGQKDIISVQFKIIKDETSSTSKALKKELDKSSKIFKSQWNSIKSYR